VLTKINAGESFEELAKQFSDDVGTKKNGGDLGWFGAGMMVKPFEEAIMAMKVGDVSTPVKSQYGFHIIELLDVKPEVVRSFAEVRTQLEKDIQKEGAETKFEGQAEQFGNLAFSDDVLEGGYNSEPIEIGEQHAVILRLKDHEQAKAKPLDELKQEIVSAITRDKTRAEAQSLGKTLLDQIKQTGDSKSTGATDLNWSPAQWIKRKDTTLKQPVIVREAFKIPVTEESTTDDRQDELRQKAEQQQQALGTSEFGQLVSGLKADAEIKDYSKKLSDG